jgi:2-oxoglutarate dehydrogenase E2 component (dihydrolipoamide succinyltransferase)
MCACIQRIQDGWHLRTSDLTDSFSYTPSVFNTISIATPSGLFVPVLRNVETMSFANIEQHLVDVKEAAMEGALAIEDLTGGTFTIVNSSVYGALCSTPMITSPQSATLGMHGIQMRPVVQDDGKIVIKPVMFLALTYDHRIIDGKEAVTFLKSVADKIQTPNRLLLGV